MAASNSFYIGFPVEPDILKLEVCGVIIENSLQGVRSYSEQAPTGRSGTKRHLAVLMTSFRSS